MIEFWRSQLQNSSGKIYDLILCAIKQKQPCAKLAIIPSDLNEIQLIYASVLRDHPELYYVSPQLSIEVNFNSMIVNLSYLYDDKQMQEINQSLDSMKQLLSKGLYNQDVDKVYAAAFSIATNSRYEINIIFNQNAAAAIHYHAAQCSGFASAFKLAMDYLGIWCIVVAGRISSGEQNGSHAWNIIKLNNSYYHIDITSVLASLKIAGTDFLNKNSLLQSDYQIKQMGYVWDTSKVPMCAETEKIYPVHPNGFGDYTHHKQQARAANDNSLLPTFTRLFDVQAKILQCLKNRANCLDFMINIPVYSNEKLMRMVANILSEQAKELSVDYEAEIGFTNGVFHLKIDYNN